MDLDLLRELWQRYMMVATLSEEDWQEAQQEFSLSEMASEIIEADYEGAFSGQTAVSGLSAETYEYLYNLQNQ